MAKYGDRYPKHPLPRYHDLTLVFPSITVPKVLSEHPGSLQVQCECGRRFEYLQDQVNCTQCTRVFNPSDAEDYIWEPLN